LNQIMGQIGKHNPFLNGPGAETADGTIHRFPFVNMINMLENFRRAAGLTEAFENNITHSGRRGRMKNPQRAQWGGLAYKKTAAGGWFQNAFPDEV